MDVIPVEVKAGETVHHSNSLKKYITEKHPGLAVRYSLLNYKKQETLVNIPLYLVDKTKEYIKI